MAYVFFLFEEDLCVLTCFDFYILYSAKIKEDIARSTKIHKCIYDVL